MLPFAIVGERNPNKPVGVKFTGKDSEQEFSEWNLTPHGNASIVVRRGKSSTRWFIFYVETGKKGIVRTLGEGLTRGEAERDAENVVECMLNVRTKKNPLTKHKGPMVTCGYCGYPIYRGNQVMKRPEGEYHQGEYDDCWDKVKVLMPTAWKEEEGNPKPHTQVEVDKLPKCDFCGETAHYDGQTGFGGWANMCKEHFAQYGTGLGLGHGQKLVLKGSTTKKSPGTMAGLRAQAKFRKKGMPWRANPAETGGPRIFNGKMYQFSAAGERSQIERDARDLKRSGYPVRVVKVVSPNYDKRALYVRWDAKPLPMSVFTGRKNPTYAQEMMKKYGVPFDPKRVKGAGGFRFKNRVEVVGKAEAAMWGGPQEGSLGTVWAIQGAKGLSVSPDPAGAMIYVKWDNGKESSVWKRSLKKIKG